MSNLRHPLYCSPAPEDWLADFAERDSFVDLDDVQEI
jgi:hypothetical protein